MARLLIMAWRNVWRNWRRTVIALVAIGLGLTCQFFLDGTYDGSKEAIFGNAVRLQGGNLMVHAPGYRERAKRMPLLPLADAEAVVQTLLAQPEAVAASRRINTSGMVSSREGTFPVVISGIEPEQEAPVGLLAENIAAGRYLTAQDEDLILIGQAMAERLDVSVGDRVTLVGRATHEQMRSRTVTVVGIYDLGISEVEKGLVYISLLEAQTLFDLRDQATEVVASLQSVGQEAQVVAVLRAALPGYEVDSWEELSPDLAHSFDANEQFAAIFGLVVLLIVGLGVLNLLLMAVFERTREIGLLAAMGLKRRDILTLFLFEGILIGLMGALAGCLLGGLVVGYVGRVGIDWSSAQELNEMTALLGSRIYPRLGVELLVERALAVAVIAVLASLYPAWQASKREPAEALHYV